MGAVLCRASAFTRGLDTILKADAFFRLLNTRFFASASVPVFVRTARHGCERMMRCRASAARVSWHFL